MPGVKYKSEQHRLPNVTHTYLSALIPLLLTQTAVWWGNTTSPWKGHRTAWPRSNSGTKKHSRQTAGFMKPEKRPRSCCRLQVQTSSYLHKIFVISQCKRDGGIQNYTALKEFETHSARAARRERKHLKEGSRRALTAETSVRTETSFLFFFFPLVEWLLCNLTSIFLWPHEFWRYLQKIEEYYMFCIWEAAVVAGWVLQRVSLQHWGMQFTPRFPSICSQFGFLSNHDGLTTAAVHHRPFSASAKEVELLV